MQRLLLAIADVIGSSAATQTTLCSFHIICIIFGHFFKARAKHKRTIKLTAFTIIPFT